MKILSRGNFENGRLEIWEMELRWKMNVLRSLIRLTQSSLTGNKNLGFTLGKADQFQSLALYSILS